MYLLLIRKSDLNSLNPSLVTIATIKEDSRAMDVNNPYLLD